MKDKKYKVFEYLEVFGTFLLVAMSVSLNDKPSLKFLKPTTNFKV